jgi:hypothetical protein
MPEILETRELGNLIAIFANAHLVICFNKGSVIASIPSCGPQLFKKFGQARH